MDNSFINYIKSIVEIPKDQEVKFSSLLSLKRIKEGENFLREGQMAKNIGFVNSGLFRYYYLDDKGSEFTKGFFIENSILISYGSILEKRDSYFTIQALEDAYIEVIDFQKFQELFEEDSCWKEMLLILLQKALLSKIERERELLLFDAEHRYRAFLRKFPNPILR